MMKTQGYCNYSIINVRRRPGHTEEIVNQLLFGDEYKINEQQGEWVHIVSLHDCYPGWIHFRQVCPKSVDLPTDPDKRYYVSRFLAEARSLRHPGKIVPMVYGTVLHHVHGNRCNLWGDLYEVEGVITKIQKPENADDLIQTALKYHYSPYMWGGRTPFGIDCSGLTQVTYSLWDIHLPRDAWMQAESGEKILFQDSCAGDLAFFGDTPGKISHVGIILNDRSILHASGSVRIDLFNEQGIFNVDDRSLSHKLQKIRRINIF